MELRGGREGRGNILGRSQDFPVVSQFAKLRHYRFPLTLLKEVVYCAA